MCLKCASQVSLKPQLDSVVQKEVSDGIELSEIDFSRCLGSKFMGFSYCTLKLCF